ncbi:hypothetical protein [Ruminococcus sp.]|uniref:hypothetical protein n=1 Tax=Ruminococcus sp. TaxID=41978 RepID=UPI003AB7011E
MKVKLYRLISIITEMSKDFFEYRGKYSSFEQMLMFCHRLISRIYEKDYTSSSEVRERLFCCVSEAKLPNIKLNITAITARNWKSFYRRNKDCKEQIKQFKKYFPTERDSFIFLCTKITGYLTDCNINNDVCLLSKLSAETLVEENSGHEKVLLNIEVCKALELIEIFTLLCYTIRRISTLQLCKNIKVYLELCQVINYCIKENVNEIEKYYPLPRIPEISQKKKRTECCS